jgi:hypothetical protein
MGLPDFSANLSRPSLPGLNNRIWFFVDDFQSLYFYPDTPEAGSGLIDSITVSTDVAAVPLPPSIVSQILASVFFPLLGWLKNVKPPLQWQPPNRYHARRLQCLLYPQKRTCAVH